MKQIEDSQQIRRALVNCFERANIPGLTDEQKEKILSFVVIGAGPTGVCSNHEIWNVRLRWFSFSPLRCLASNNRNYFPPIDQVLSSPVSFGIS